MDCYAKGNIDMLGAVLCGFYKFRDDFHMDFLSVALKFVIFYGKTSVEEAKEKVQKTEYFKEYSEKYGKDFVYGSLDLIDQLSNGKKQKKNLEKIFLLWKITSTKFWTDRKKK